MKFRIQANKYPFKECMVALLILLAVGCSKDDHSPSEPAPLVQDISFDGWGKVALNAPNYKGQRFWVSSVGDNIFIANNSSSLVYDQFFIKYNVVDNNVVELPKNNEITRDGYESILVTDNNNLYYFANNGVKFNPNHNSWTAVNYPKEFRDGESGGCYLDGKIYYVGGRNSAKAFRVYDISTDSWKMMSEEYHYEAVEPSVVGHDHKLYVMGGYSNATKKVSVFDPSSGTWTKKKDFPYNLRLGSYPIVYKGLIYVLASGGVYGYNPELDEWKEPFPIPDNMDHRFTIPVVCNSAVYLVGFDKDSYELILYKLKEK